MLYLFGDIPTEEHSAYGLNHVHSASDQWSNVLKHIREQDGSVLTLFESAKMKGQKGYRDLHGDTLRGVLGTILQSLVSNTYMYMNTYMYTIILVQHLHVYIIDG